MSCQSADAGRFELRGNFLVGIVGAFRGRIRVRSGPVSVEDGLVGSPIAAGIGAAVLLFLSRLTRIPLLPLMLLEPG